MTMVVEITDPTRVQPIEGLQLDLDCTEDYKKLEELYGEDTVMVAVHLYPGESLKIECIDRVDDY